MLLTVRGAVQGFFRATLGVFCSYYATDKGKAYSAININEPPHGKTNNLHMQKQRRRSASR